MVEHVLDVENRAQVRAHPLTVLDPDGLLRHFHDHGTVGITLLRSIDDDTQHPATRLPPQLDVEDVEPAGSSDPFGHRPDALQARIGCHVDETATPETQRVGKAAHSGRVA